VIFTNRCASSGQRVHEHLRMPTHHFTCRSR
jgi:hypothetical protein